jgi:hypothetical protein
MMNFLTYITWFFMKFELLPILTDYANNPVIYVKKFIIMPIQLKFEHFLA